MQIKLITQEQYNLLKSIYANHPELTLQNKGYEYITVDNLLQEDKGQLKVVNDLLAKHISGFSKFSNFRLSNQEELQIRFQYDYGYDGGLHFIGVGYILLEELLNGFKENELTT